MVRTRSQLYKNSVTPDKALKKIVDNSKLKNKIAKRKGSPISKSKIVSENVSSGELLNPVAMSQTTFNFPVTQFNRRDPGSWFRQLRGNFRSQQNRR